LFYQICKTGARKETLVPYKICSFDIEASSSHGDFPIPKKTYKRLATNIIDIFDKQANLLKSGVPRINQLITKIIMTAFGFDRFENVDTIYPINPPKKCELADLINAFFEIKQFAVKDTK
jgi:hypothetical protein